MFTRFIFRRFSTTNTKIITNNRPSRLFRWLDIYEDFVGLKEVKQAQTNVNDAEREFINCQTERRLHSDDLVKLQSELDRIRQEMEKFSRSDDRYLESFKKEHEFVKIEKSLKTNLGKQDETERDLFSKMQLALRESQEKEKMRLERTKYWSIIGSVLGALAGMIGATLSNRYRMQEFRNITEESRKLYEDLITKQEISINELKKDLLIPSSSKDYSYEQFQLLNEQSEARIQSNIINHTDFMIFSASFISLIITYFFNR